MTGKPGEKALEAMKNLDNAVVIFKKPQIPRTKQGKMKILTEEQYVEVNNNNFSSNNFFTTKLWNFLLTKIGTW